MSRIIGVGIELVVKTENGKQKELGVIQHLILGPS